jgi:tRNA threonylcarbamoyladenosine biosynthesis protein TsaE
LTDMIALSFTSHSEAETLALARKLSASFKSGDVIVLSGPLGAGKTVFVKGLAEGRGIASSAVSSPTFSFVHEYRGDSPVYHFDLYRIKSVDELYEIGWDDYLQRDGVIVVEWGERAEDLLPERFYRIEIMMISDDERRFDLTLEGA